MHQDLGGGFELTSAPEREYGIHHAVYRRVNPEFYQTYLEHGSDLEGIQHCFWVTKDARRVGGIIIRPNHVEGLFVIPPFTDAWSILAAARPLLLHWSDPSRDIEASEVFEHEVDLYYRAGFRLDCIRRHQIRPTGPCDVTWDDDLDVRTCQDGTLEDLCRLLVESFAGGVAHYGRYTADDYRKRFATFPEGLTNDTIWGRASTLLYDRPTGRLIGACLVQMVDGVPAVGYVAVQPQWRRRKLATRMIRKALSALHGEYPLLKVQVFVGNDAEAVYRNLGFEPGPRRYTLRIPAGTF
ncbi:MAG: GNAT family N-acetyltransferase [Planctomycetota bacterium]|jgi:GNAT superfamily N-acetyltransferase